MFAVTSSIPPPFLQLHILVMYVWTPLSRFYCTPDWEWVLAIISFSFCLLTIPIVVLSSIHDRFVTFVSIESILSHTWLRLVLSTIGYGPHHCVTWTKLTSTDFDCTKTITMSLPSLTILSEEQKFNGDNLLQWETNMIQLLASKGLSGYVNGKIPKPEPEAAPLPPEASETTTTQHITTPIYSSTPTLDRWIFRDQLARGHIMLNCTDVASLGVVTTETAKEAWDSIQTEWGKSTDMRRSHAQESLNWMTYVEGTEIQDHVKLLHTWKAVVDNLSTSAMTDETWRGIIIQSIPPTAKWLPIIPSLYMLSSSADVILTLLAHGIILARDKLTISTTSSNTALAAWTT